MTTLHEVLRRQYAIEATAVTPCEGGLSAQAFRVDAVSGPFLLKVYDKARAATSLWTGRIDGYVPVLDWLNQNTALRGRIVQPVRTADGRCKHEDGQSVYLLYRYVVGAVVGEAQLTEGQAQELGHTLGMLHRVGEGEAPGLNLLPREDFALPFCDSLERFLSNRRQEPDCEAARLLSEHLPALWRATDRTRTLAAELKARSPRLTLCHTDLHNYNLIQGAKLVLIDWEGLMLAPPEHDLMFVAGQPYYDAFMAAYAQHHPGFAMNAGMLEFYLLRRDLEDIWAFAEQLAFDAPGESERDRAMGFLQGLLAQLDAPKESWKIG